MTRKLYPHNFKDSGRSISVRKVPPYLVRDYYETLIPPAPPKQMVAFGESGVLREEENVADPDYIRALKVWEKEATALKTKFLIREGVVIFLSDTDKAEIQELREHYRDEYNLELAPRDEDVFLYNICIETPEDMTELVNAITRRNTPTEGGVQQAINTFRA